MANSTMVRTHEAKRNAAIAAIAIALAKKKGDPLYNKLVRHKTAWKKASAEIAQKYSGVASTIWAQNQSKKK